MLTIRPATADDIDTITDANLAMAAETEQRELDRDTVARAVRRAIAHPSLGTYYLAERDGAVIGQLLVTSEFSDWRDGSFWWIQSVYINPEARQAGVYRALHQHVVRAARQQPEVCGVRLYVDASNTRAQQVYEHLGLTPTEYRLYETDWSNEPG